MSTEDKENANPAVNRMKAYDKEYKDPLLEAFDEEEKLASSKKTVSSTKEGSSDSDDSSSGEEGSGSGSEDEGSDIQFPKGSA